MGILIAQQLVDQLIAERQRQGLSQAEVAKRMGAAISWVQAIEYNKQPGRQISAFQRYADALNAEVQIRIVRE